MVLSDSFITENPIENMGNQPISGDLLHPKFNRLANQEFLID